MTLVEQLKFQCCLVKQLRQQADPARLEEEEPIFKAVVFEYARFLSRLRKNRVWGVEADDIASEASLSVFALQPHFVEVAQFYPAYISSVVRNIVSNHRNGLTKTVQPEEGANPEQEGPTEQEKWEHQTRLRKAREFLQRLSLADRIVVSQKAGMLSVDQARRKLGMTKITYQRYAKTRLERLRRKLRRII